MIFDNSYLEKELVNLGVPEEDVKKMQFSMTEVIKDGVVFAKHKLFLDFKQPLFWFANGSHKNLQDSTTKDYKLCLCPNMTPALVLDGQEHASETTWNTVSRCLTNFMTDPFYDLHQKAGAFFQGGSNNPLGGYIFVEFWKPKGAQAWLDAFNKELKIRRSVNFE